MGYKNQRTKGLSRDRKKNKKRLKKVVRKLKKGCMFAPAKTGKSVVAKVLNDSDNLRDSVLKTFFQKLL